MAVYYTITIHRSSEACRWLAAPIFREGGQKPLMHMKLATVKEIAETLSVSKSTVYSWVSQGAIPSFRINGIIRFNRDEVEGWVKSSKSKTSELPRLKPRQATRHQDIDTIVKNAIDSVKGKDYRSGKKR